MSEAAGKLTPNERLRVAIRCDDGIRRARLALMVDQAGHLVVGLHDSADVVLADGGSSAGETRIVIALGGPEDGSPGLLPRDADASQSPASACELYQRYPEFSPAKFGKNDAEAKK